MSNTSYCVNCGNQLTENLDYCSECDSSQKPGELDLSEEIIEARQDPQPPFEIPQDVYHNENWEHVKSSFIAPYGLAILFIIIIIPVSFLPEPVFLIILAILLIALILGTLGSFIAFAVYVSRDKKLLFEESGHSKVREPITIIIFLFFFHVFYQLYYLAQRSSKYEIENEDSVSSN